MNTRNYFASLLMLVAVLALVTGFNLPSPSLTITRPATSLRPHHYFPTTSSPSRLQTTLNPGGQEFLGEEDASLIAKEEEKPKVATVMSSTANLVKSILGTGVLALPAGVAAVSDMRIALIPASVLVMALGIASAYTFQVYGRLAHETQATNLGDMWESTMGGKSSWIISAGTFAFCFGVALVYALVIGDFLSSLAMSLGNSIPAFFSKRQFWILSVTLSTLYPLCNLKSLASLAPMSLVGVAGTLLTTIFMAIRCPAIVPGSPYSTAPLGKYAASLAPSLAPKFGNFIKLMSPASLIIVSMAATAYIGHFNAPALYHGFKKPKSETTGVEESAKENDQALKNFGIMTAFGFAGCTILNIIIMAIGFLTFGGNSAGVVLNNYATADKGAVLSRLLMTLSVVGGYPFMVAGCKTNFLPLYNTFKKGNKASPATVEKWVVRSVIGIATCLSLIISDAGLVVSLLGALMGSCIIYTFPCMMFLKHTATGGTLSRKLKMERFLLRFLIAFGIFSGLVGAAVSVVGSVAPHLLR